MSYGPYYSLTRILSTTMPAYNTQLAMDFFKDALVICGWTLLGSFAGFGSTTGYELKSFPTRIIGSRMRVKIYWDGTTQVGFGYPILQISVAASDGSNATVFNSLTIRNDLGNKTFRLICNAHQFFIYLDPTIPPNSNYTNVNLDRNTAMGGVPVQFSLLPIGNECFWFLQGQTDFRVDLVPAMDTNTNFAFMFGSLYRHGAVNLANAIAPQLLSQRGSELHNPVRMFSGNYPVISPILMMGEVGTAVRAFSLWDAIVVGTSYASKIETLADYNTWENLTIGGVVGTLFLVTGSNLALTVPGFAY